ncbi:MAG: Ppx/GppA phosphatase family protein [Hyphomicrobiaceae bacterium]
MGDATEHREAGPTAGPDGQVRAILEPQPAAGPGEQACAVSARAGAYGAASSKPCEHHSGKVGLAQAGGGARGAGAAASQRQTAAQRSSLAQPAYAALDLGTNNCRLLIARPTRRGIRVVDSFSRIIRLGEGLTLTGSLSEAAMSRTIDALKVCAAKINRHEVLRSRLVATQACRMAHNGEEFVARVRHVTGLELEILSRENEARLAVAGCASLLDADCDLALVFDIGGGSSELVWLDLKGMCDGAPIGGARGHLRQARVIAWTSLSVGVVTLAERFGGRHVTPESFEAMVEDVLAMITPFEAEHRIAGRIEEGRVHFLGTSGTVTTVAGIRLRLPRYDRTQVDGCWLDTEHVRDVTTMLLHKSYEQRCAEPCIGRERGDLVLAGCAILEALLRIWPTDRLRVADRGLREGILSLLMAEDGYPRSSRRRGRRRS